MSKKTDAELLEALTDVDEDEDVNVSAWEADFMNSIFTAQKKPGARELTEKQRAVIERIIDEYA